MAESEELKIGGIILAAGGSSRLGQPKQFIKLEGKTLLRRAAEAVTGSQVEKIVLVLGAENDAAKMEVSDLPLRICINKNWQSGMSSSIKTGLDEILSIEPDLDAVVVTLCDQPYVDSTSIDALVQKFVTSRKQMVAAGYEGVAGVPALFSRQMFPALMSLEGDKGARDLLRDPAANVDTIEIKKAATDIDNADDIRRLNSE